MHWSTILFRRWKKNFIISCRCVNAGHCRTPIVDAIKKQVTELIITVFNMSHKRYFIAEIAELMPENLNKIFFTNSACSSDSSLYRSRIFSGYWRKVQDSLQERRYHGVGFGGISVGGIPPTESF